MLQESFCHVLEFKTNRRGITLKTKGIVWIFHSVLICYEGLGVFQFLTYVLNNGAMNILGWGIFFFHFLAMYLRVAFLSHRVCVC